MHVVKENEKENFEEVIIKFLERDKSWKASLLTWEPDQKENNWDENNLKNLRF